MPTDHQDTTLSNQRNVLCTKLEVWVPLHAIYMPGLLQYLEDIGESHSLSLEDGDRKPEEIKLWLPSSLPSFATKYRVAREAKLGLIGPGPWEEALQILENKDICAYTDPEHRARGPGQRGTNEDNDEPQRESNVAPEEEIDVELEERGLHGGTSETCRSLSWIWQTTTINLYDGTDKNDEILRSEWCRSHARSKRSQEEVLLLQEEMRCVLSFLGWKAHWWWERHSLREVRCDEGLRESLHAYAFQQRDLQLTLKSSFQSLWLDPLQEVEIHLNANTSTNKGVNEGEADDDDNDDNDLEIDSDLEGDGEGSDFNDSDNEET
ncbi:hypothetical protein ARMSODRAFT_1021087 [Armillaria solidipes]|uniref:Uncharacterized protein n=1 Tax=Armillaria solidipes TaxID=1076256 RepID=A0A2H3B6V5_9AGAR|nr:hypothetical protein ARMSODRAFT_1021087 [Armillaria solidipes]